MRQVNLTPQNIKRVAEQLGFYGQKEVAIWELL